MKKNALIALSMIMLSVFSMTFTACGNDDDDDAPVIVTPKYAEDAALYQICGKSDITSIEFTESGMYVITKKGKSAAKGFGKFFKGKSYRSITRSEDDDYEYIHGKYTKNGDVYTLEGFGTITVVKKEDVNVSLQIQQTGKKAYTLSAQPTEKIEKSDISTKLCRTWKFERSSLLCTKNDSVILDKTYAKNSTLLEAIDTIYGENGGKPDTYSDAKEMIFTLSGTYIVKYGDGTLAVAQWKWKNEKEGTFYYAWEGIWEEDNVLKLSFNEKNELVLAETNVDTWHGDKYKFNLTYYLTELK